MVSSTFCGSSDKASAQGLCRKMRGPFLAYAMLGTVVTAFHKHETPCFGVCMMGKGFGNQSNKKPAASGDSNKVAVPSSTPPKNPAVGELPEDSFSQFPPLTPEQQSTLVGAKGGDRGMPTEVSPTAHLFMFRSVATFHISAWAGSC